MKTEIVQGFNDALWKGGVDEGAFAGDRDPDGIWYLLKAGGDTVAIAGAVPGPADLTTVSYYVHPDFRGLGYGTKIASRVTDLHEKATFTIFKDNDASIKVALAALRNKFSMTMGHNVVRLTKTADLLSGGKADEKTPKDFNPKALAEGAKHETEHTSNKAVAKEIAMDHLTEDPNYYKKIQKIEKKSAAAKKVEEEPEKPKMKGPPLITYLDDVAMILKGLKSEMPAMAETAIKTAVSERFVQTRIKARDLANRKGVSNYALGEAAKVVQEAPLGDMTAEARKALRGTVAFSKKFWPAQPQKTTEFVGKIKDKIGPQEKLL